MDKIKRIDIANPTEPYVLNPSLRHLLPEGQAEEYQRLLGVWRDKGWECREDVTDLFDEDADWTAVDGIGEVRAPLMAELMALEGWAFTAWTGLPVKCPDFFTGDSAE